MMEVSFLWNGELVTLPTSDREILNAHNNPRIHSQNQWGYVMACGVNEMAMAEFSESVDVARQKHELRRSDDLTSNEEVEKVWDEYAELRRQHQEP